MIPIRKYPRTHHLEGSRLGPGDEDLSSIPFGDVRDIPLVIEEKIDGANCALSFDEDGSLLLQSRGHYLVGGAREKHFDRLKPWAHTHADAFGARLGARYVMYGEWAYAKHTVFYDALPAHFLEFDILDRERDVFLSTEARRSLLDGLPVTSVPVIGEGRFRSLGAVTSLVRRSLYKTEAWRERLAASARERDLDVDRIFTETDPSDESEGLYIKHEADGVVAARYKWVRKSFLQSVVDSGSHWLARPIIPNLLA